MLYPKKKTRERTDPDEVVFFLQTKRWLVRRKFTFLVSPRRKKNLVYNSAIPHSGSLLLQESPHNLCMIVCFRCGRVSFMCVFRVLGFVLFSKENIFCFVHFCAATTASAVIEIRVIFITRKWEPHTLHDIIRCCSCCRKQETLTCVCFLLRNMNNSLFWPTCPRCSHPRPPCQQAECAHPSPTSRFGVLSPC